MSVVAVIPARGGSKRIPGKNIRLFAGKPIIAWSIEAAFASGLFERVLVSTDDDRIAETARAFGAEAPFRRPAELSDDLAGTMPVVAHAIAWLRRTGVTPTTVCCIYPTAPLIRVSDLIESLRLLREGNWQYVFPATTFAAPIFRAFRDEDVNGLAMFFPEHFWTRSQDLPEALHDAGQFYWGRAEAWLQGLPIFGALSSVIRIPRDRTCDIDTEEDWRVAELLHRIMTITPRGLSG